MSNQANSIPPVDLVIVIDTSRSMKDEAQALSNAAASAIARSADAKGVSPMPNPVVLQT